MVQDLKLSHPNLKIISESHDNHFSYKNLCIQTKIINKILMIIFKNNIPSEIFHGILVKIFYI